MFNSRTDRPNDPKELGRPLKPAYYDPPGSAAKPAAPAHPPRPQLSPPPSPVRETPPPAPPSVATVPIASSAPTAASAPTAGAATLGAPAGEAGSSKLFIGVNIKLKGVEISDCDVLVIEGQVEATVHSKEMQIDQPGTLTGTALIDIAEIRGEFSGELTARTRLVVHGTGRVSGTIRYGKLVVAEGGELTGDVKRLDSELHPQKSLLPPEGRRAHAAASDPVPTVTNPVQSGAARAHS